MKKILLTYLGLIPFAPGICFASMLLSVHNTLPPKTVYVKTSKDMTQVSIEPFIPSNDLLTTDIFKIKSKSTEGKVTLQFENFGADGNRAGLCTLQLSTGNGLPGWQVEDLAYSGNMECNIDNKFGYQAVLTLAEHKK